MAAQKALRAACVRMPDREACAAELAAAMSRAPAATRPILLEILGDMGGAKALATIGAAVKGSDPSTARHRQPRARRVDDVGCRAGACWIWRRPRRATSTRFVRCAVTFAWRDNLPSRTSSGPKCAKTHLDASSRPAEQQLVLTVLERLSQPRRAEGRHESKADPALKEDATRVALAHHSKAGRQGRRRARAAGQARPGAGQGGDHQGRIRRRGQAEGRDRGASTARRRPAADHVAVAQLQHELRRRSRARNPSNN